MNATVRNILVVFALAALLVLIPGGGTGASVALQALSLAFLGALVWFASMMYRPSADRVRSPSDVAVPLATRG